MFARGLMFARRLMFEGRLMVRYVELKSVRGGYAVVCEHLKGWGGAAIYTCCELTKFHEKLNDVTILMPFFQKNALTTLVEVLVV